jgi:hypothetical protein
MGRQPGERGEVAWTGEVRATGTPSRARRDAEECWTGATREALPLAVEPCSGACREAIELYFSTPARALARAYSAWVKADWADTLACPKTN